MEIKDTSAYQSVVEEALEKFQIGAIDEAKKLLAAAEDWLDTVRNDGRLLEAKNRATPEKLPGRWLDHREYTLFKAFRSIGDFKGAQRLIDSMTSTPHNIATKSKEGRQEILNAEINAAKR